MFSIAVKAQQIDSLGKKSATDKQLQARKDSAKANPIVPKPKEKTWHPDSNHSPHKAVIRSLEIPGWGQLYNHQWYLVPPIYAGLGLLVYNYISNLNDYHGYLAVAQYREHGTAPARGDKYYDLYQNYTPYPTTTIDDAVTGSNRNVEICVFSFAAVWGIQVIQAYIEAKFQHSYSMDSNLSLKVSPTFMNQQQAYATNFNSAFNPGLKLTFTLK